MQSDDGSLLARQPPVASIEVGIGLQRGGPIGILAVRQPEPWKNPSPQPKRSPYTNLAEPRGTLQRIAQGRPGAPGQFHGFLHRVLGFLDIPEDRIGHGEEATALHANRGLEPVRVADRLGQRHDHVTIESARRRLVYEMRRSRYGWPGASVGWGGK